MSNINCGSVDIKGNNFSVLRLLEAFVTGEVPLLGIRGCNKFLAVQQQQQFKNDYSDSSGDEGEVATDNINWKPEIEPAGEAPPACIIL